MFQIEEHDRTSEIDLNNVEESVLSEKEFKVIVIKMLMELRESGEYSENFNKEIESIRKNEEGGAWVA